MLEMKNISFKADDGKDIVKNINITVPEGQIVAVTGPNGGGKSTVAKLFSGIYKSYEGQILLDGKDITALDITERANEGLGYGFQRPVSFKGFRVRDIINIAAGKEMSNDELKDIMGTVGLCMYDYIDRELNSNLSGGEQKRIEIATVLARKTKYNIFDEPEAGIDIWSFRRLISVFESLRKTSSAGQLIISHQRGILDIADKIIVISGGEVTAQGTPCEILPNLFDGENCGDCPVGKRCSDE
ncbi:MAG: ATP-binding cassette domain-containing protein [Ruminococcaceae bacterium]|nr:ATP-binding cassette domain-containing protein [Oscillospiraceae bacterium]